MARKPIKTSPLRERHQERGSVFMLSSYSLSAEVFSFCVEFILVDLSARIPLAQDIERSIASIIASLAYQPANQQYDTDDNKRPKQHHHKHHAESPRAPHHWMHPPSPFVWAFLYRSRPGNYPIR